MVHDEVLIINGLLTFLIPNLTGINPTFINHQSKKVKKKSLETSGGATWISQPGAQPQHPHDDIWQSLLGCRLGHQWVISHTCKWGMNWGYNPLILTIDPNFLGHPSMQLSLRGWSIALGIVTNLNRLICQLESWLVAVDAIDPTSTFCEQMILSVRLWIRLQIITMEKLWTMSKHHHLASIEKFFFQS